MLNTTLYIDKNSDTELRVQEDKEDIFLLNISEMFNFDLDIVGPRKLFERIYEILESNLYEYSYVELEKKLANTELLLEDAQTKIEGLEERLELKSIF
ncbi:hypothetical protein ACXATD_002490 [Clostridium sporogenes]